MIVVDGGSRDGTVEVASQLADQVLVAPRGRAIQMNTGAAVASGSTLLFLHADCRLPASGIAADRRHARWPVTAGAASMSGSKATRGCSRSSRR